MADFRASFPTILKPSVRKVRRSLRRKNQKPLDVEQLEKREVPALVAAYNFDQGVGTQLTDLSGNNNDGTITKATWSTKAVYGSSLYFNGVNSMVTVADSASLNLSSGMTVEAWVDPTNSNGWQTAVFKERSGGLSYALYGTTGNRSPSALADFSGSDMSAASGSLKTGKWIHLAGTYDGAFLRIYVNGQLMSTTAVSGSIMNSSGGALRLGGNSLWGQYFKGYMDDVRIYNNALSQAQIQSDMQTPVTAPSVTLAVSAGADGTINEGGSFQFNGSASGGSGTYTYSWNFGDGSTGSGASISHVYTQSGTYTAVLKATDAFGNTGTDSVVVTVVNVAPSGLTLSQSSTSISEGGSMTLSGSFTDPGADTETVVIKWGDGKSTTLNLSSTQRTFSATHQYLDNPAGQPNGSFTISVSVTDQNNVGTSGIASIQVSDVAPSATILIALYDNDKTVTFAAGVTDPGTLDTFTYQWNFGDGATSTLASPSHTYANYGNYIVSLTVTDKDGLSSTVTKTVTLVDGIAPTVSVTSPAAGSTVSGVVTITASATDNNSVAGVTFYVDGVAMGAEDTVAPYSYNWDTTQLANGTHTLTAKARDAAGNTATSAALTVTVNNSDITAPTVSITGPTTGSSVSGTINITANASDNVGVAGVTFYLDGVAMGPEDTASPYSYSCDTTKIANGTHTLTAMARDAAGNTATSAAVAVTVNNVTDAIPPTVSLTAPTAGSTVSGTVSVTANAGDNVGVAGVTFYVDGVAIAPEDTTFTFGVSWDTTKATNGTHTLTAVARDTAGNTTTSSPVVVTVSNVTTSTLVMALNCGGSAVGSFSADANYTSSSVYSNSDTINTSTAIGPAPAALYDSERYGTSFSYTIPNLTAGATYTVRLHFAEIYWSSAGMRAFNVAINGTQVLGNFDPFAAAGGKDIANVQQFSAAADASGQFVISFTTVINAATVSGIEIYSGVYTPPLPPPPDTTPPTVTSATPIAGATGVGVVSPVTVYFSEALDPTTVTSATVHVKDASGQMLTGTMYYYSSNKSVVIDPNSNFAFSSTYTIEVVGGANGIKDLAGNPLASTLTSTFTTGAAPTAGGQFIVTPYDNIPNFGANPTIVSAASGNWSSASTWSTGVVPAANDIVSIAGGTTVTYDVTMASANAIKSLVIQAGGKLIFRTDISTTLYVSNLLVLQNGELDVGTEAQPVSAAVTASIVIANKPLDTSTDPAQYGNSLIGLGKVSMVGAAKPATFIRLATEPKAGQTTLTLSQPATGWRVGDRVILPDTRQLFGTDLGSGYVSQLETLNIAAISADGLTITLSAALKYDHLGAHDVNGGLTFLPHVVNLTRNVVVRSESATGNRGSVMFTYRADVDIQYVQFSGLGRTKNGAVNDTTFDANGNVTNVGSNQEDRNPVQFRHLFGPATPQADGYQYTFVGNSVFCPISPMPFAWGVNINDSDYGLIKDNVIYNWAGAGLITKTGSEVYNMIDHNIVVFTTGDSTRIDVNATAGSGYWFAGPNNYVRNNVATDINASGPNVYSYGFNVFAYFRGTLNVPIQQGADLSIAGQSKPMDMNATPLLDFSNDETYGASLGGLSTWWLGTYYETVKGNAGTIKNFHVWNHSVFGYFPYESNNLVVDGFVARGDVNALTNPNENVKGIYFGDYMTLNAVVTNADIQGMWLGVETTTNMGHASYGHITGSTWTIQNSYLANEIDIYIPLIQSTNGGVGLAPRTIYINNVTFGHTALVDTSGWIDIQMDDFMHYDPSYYNTTAADLVYVYNYDGNAADNFQVFYSDKAPAGTSMRARVAGMVKAF